MWGTDTAGSLWKPIDRRDEAMLDVPFPIDNRTWMKPDTAVNNSADEDSNNKNEEEEETIRKVVCGPTDTAVLTSAGRLFVSGGNAHGQLGVGHANPVREPTALILPSDDGISTTTATTTTKVQDVALGVNCAAFVDTAGDLYTCGFGGSTLAGAGCLGHGDLTSRHQPTLVTSLVEDGCAVEQVVIGEAHLTVLTTEGEILCTGAGSYGRLGNLDTLDQLYLEPVELLTPDSGIIQIAGGKSFTLALSKDGVVYGWGRNHKGQLGTGLGLAVDMYAMQSVPEPIETDELVNRRIVHVAAGHSHAAAIADTGELFYWGMALHLEPVRVDALLHTKIVRVTCGQDYTLAVDVDGNMYSLGWGKTGVLGQGSVRRLNQATLMEALAAVPGQRKVVQATAGWKHAACLVEDSGTSGIDIGVAA